MRKVLAPMARAVALKGGAEPGARIDKPPIFLRRPLMSDCQAWLALRRQSRDFLVPWEPTWPEDALTRGAFRRRVRAYNKDWRAGLTFAFFAFRSEDSELLGGVTLADVRRGVSQSAHLGYWIGEPFAKRGYMTLAVSAALDFAFTELSLNRVEAACMPKNRPSQALLKKLGFREEGFARDYLKIDGAWRDHLLFATLRADHAKRAAEAARGAQPLRSPVLRLGTT